ncbi:hypothetical protein [Sulfitobacter sp. TBRI5]|uniref:hypothetical protein n=1 Tax=Sulfitobacter sp. TBRI5 TaxID=2989732 RepID=UPI003D9B8E9D
MIKNLVLWIATAAIVAACAPVSGTVVHYQASGPNAVLGKTCGNNHSRYEFQRGTQGSESVSVSIGEGFPQSATTHRVFVMVASVGKVEINPSRIAVQANGKTYNSIEHRNFGRSSPGRSLGIDFNFGPVPPENIVVAFKSGAIRFNGANYALAPLSFQRVAVEKTVMQPLNC